MVKRVPPGKYVPCDAQLDPSQIGDNTSDGKRNEMPGILSLVRPFVTEKEGQVLVLSVDLPAPARGVVTTPVPSNGVGVTVPFWVRSVVSGVPVGINCLRMLESTMPTINRMPKRIMVPMVLRNEPFF